MKKSETRDLNKDNDMTGIVQLKVKNLKLQGYIIHYI
jgi:hypothetical protein